MLPFLGIIPSQRIHMAKEQSYLQTRFPQAALRYPLRYCIAFRYCLALLHLHPSEREEQLLWGNRSVLRSGGNAAMIIVGIPAASIALVHKHGRTMASSSASGEDYGVNALLFQLSWQVSGPVSFLNFSWFPPPPMNPKCTGATPLITPSLANS